MGLNLDSTFFYILWALFLIPCTLQLNYLTLFFLSRLKKSKPVFKILAKKELPRVSILIASYNEKYVISDTLKNLTNLDYPKSKLQIILVDDSNDGTFEIAKDQLNKIKKLGFETRLIHREERKGLKSGALNEGLKVATGKYILGIDADTLIQKDSLKNLVSYLMANPDKKYVNFRRDFYNKTFSPITKIYTFYSFLADEITKKSLSIFKIPFGYYGGCVLLETDFLKKIGGWWPNMISDDFDVSFRTWINGGSGDYVNSKIVATMEANPCYYILKKNATRVNKGNGQLYRKNFKDVLKSNLSLFQKIEFVFGIILPVAGLSIFLFTLISFAGLIMSIQSVHQIFSSIAYILFSSILNLYTLTTVLFIVKIRKLSFKNYLLPILSSVFFIGPISIYNSIGFIEGFFNKRINFFRTPKFGDNENNWKNNKSSFTKKFGVVEFILIVLSFIFAAISIQEKLYYVTFTSSTYLILTLLALVYI